MSIVPTTNYERVCQFHLVFGHPKPDTLQSEVMQKDPALISLRLALIKEELGELEEGITKLDLTEVVDALGDLIYVIYGAAIAIGYDLNEVFGLLPTRDAIASNSSQPTNFERVGLYMDAIGRLRQVSIVSLSNELVSGDLGLIKAGYARLHDSVETNNLDEFVIGLGDILCATYGMGHTLGVNLDQVVDLVHKSNMTKLCKTELEAKESIEHYATLDGFKQARIGYRQATDGIHWVVFNLDTGKILKSKYFSLPDFGSVINTAN